MVAMKTTRPATSPILADRACPGLCIGKSGINRAFSVHGRDTYSQKQ
jgi:hypothetical protein